MRVRCLIPCKFGGVMNGNNFQGKSRIFKEKVEDTRFRNYITHINNNKKNYDFGTFLTFLVLF